MKNWDVKGSYESLSGVRFTSRLQSRTKEPVSKFQLQNQQNL